MCLCLCLCLCLYLCLYLAGWRAGVLGEKGNISAENHADLLAEMERRLSSKDSKVNTFAVEQAAAAVPADAWNAVAPTEVWLTLPSPDDESTTRKLLREGLCTSLRGLSDDHAEALASMIGALSVEYSRCCEFGCLDDCCTGHDHGHGHEKTRAVRAKLSIAALDDARAAQPCPKFHADTVPMRLIATLAGRGTEVSPRR